MINNIDLVRNSILHGDSLEVLKRLPDESIDCVMTSPPYWALRNYEKNNQIGLQEDFNEYINNLCNIFDEVKRVLNRDFLGVELNEEYISIALQRIKNQSMKGIN